MDSTPAAPPVRVITPNMLIAYNMARWRRANGMTQAQLGEQLGGWTKRVVSAAERSWGGDRVRQFDADLIATLASILRVPIPAFFMPPADDGEAALYAIAGDGGPVPVGEYFSYVLPDPDFEPGSRAADAYEDAVITAVARYAGGDAAARLAAGAREAADERQLAMLLAEAREAAEGAPAMYEAIAALARNSALLAGVLERALHGDDAAGGAP